MIKNNHPNFSISLIKGEGILSVRDQAGTFVIDHERRIYWLLTGLEADIWDWFNLNYPFEEIVCFTARYLDVSDNTAKDHVFEVLHKWFSSGILSLTETQNGKSPTHETM